MYLLLFIKKINFIDIYDLLLLKNLKHVFRISYPTCKIILIHPYYLLMASFLIDFITCLVKVRRFDSIALKHINYYQHLEII